MSLVGYTVSPIETERGGIRMDPAPPGGLAAGPHGFGSAA